MANSELPIEAASNRDLKSLTALWVDAFARFGYQAADFEKLFYDLSVRTDVVRLDQKVIGAVLSKRNHAAGEVLALLVHPMHRRRGLANRLLTHLLYRFKASGVEFVRLHTAEDNRAAQGLFERHQFEVRLDMVEYPHGQKAMLYERRFNPTSVED